MTRRPATPVRDATQPLFLWDRDVSSEELRAVLADPQDPRRLELLAALLREARPDQVWDWVTPEEVARDLDALAPRLGRRRAFWEWLIAGWRELGLLPA